MFQMKFIVFKERGRTSKSSFFDTFFWDIKVTELFNNHRILFMTLIDSAKYSL